MAVLNETLVQHFLAEQSNNLTAYRTSGRQRSLSQRIVLLSIELVRAPDRQKREDLRATIEEMRASHDKLVNSDALNADLQALYFEGPYELDARLRDFWNAAESLANTTDTMLDQRDYQFIYDQFNLIWPIIDQAVAIHQKQIQDNLDWATDGSAPRVFLVIVVGVIQALVIVRPLAYYLRDKTRALTKEVAQREQAEQELRLVVDRFPNGIILFFDAQKYHRIVGGAGLEELKLSRSFLEGKCLADLPAHPLIPVAEALYERVLSGEMVVRTERYQNKVYLLQALPVRNTDEAVVGGIVIVQDITQQKVLEDALREKQRYLDEINRRIPDIIYVYDIVEKRNIFLSRPISTLLGYEEDEAVSLEALMLSEDYASYQRVQAYYAQLDDEELHEAEYRCHYINGGMRWLNIRTYVFKRDSAGAVRQVISVVQDITERKLSEEVLLESQIFIDSITDTMPDLLYVYDLDEKRNVYANRELARMLGYSYNEIQTMAGNLLDYIMHADDLVHWRTMLDRYHNAADDAVLESEYRFRHKNGDYRWLFMREKVFMRHADGRAHQILGVAQDVTDRKIAEDQARQLVLEQERINLLSAFITATSHELRTPLAAISSSLFILTRTDDAARRQAKAQVIEEQVKRISTLLDQMHRLARLDVLRHLEKIEVPLADVLQAARTAKVNLAAAKNITITLHNDTSAHIEAHLADLGDALGELLDNAIRYTHVGGEIHIEAREDDEAVYISVRDNGDGIPEEYHDRIFERFFKVNAARSADTSGNGLGLVIVKRIVELHHGTISVSSAVGRGTTFTIRLPKTRQPQLAYS